MKKAKFKIGDNVRTINDPHRTTVIGITEAAGYMYDIEHYGGSVVSRIPEGNLIKLRKQK